MNLFSSAEAPSPQRGPIASELSRVSLRIVSCTRCPRLVEYREQVARTKRKSLEHWHYWGRPVPGYGDPLARLVIVGLAPAAHGANRTGRMFTGDASAQFLTKTLYQTGFASQPTSEHSQDGLQLIDAYLTAALRCAPPGNLPTAGELRNCSPYLGEELRALSNKQVLLALGRIAFSACSEFLRQEYDIGSNFPFKHGAFYHFGEGIPNLAVSYHPSPHNTLTGRLKPESFLEVFEQTRQRLGKSVSRPSAP